MTRLILLILLGLAAWQAYIHYPTLFERHARNEVVIRNEGDFAINRLRLIAGRQTFVKEVLVPGASVTWRVSDDSDVRLKLVWFPANKPNESTWTGPEIMPGGGVERHTLLMYNDSRVTHQSEQLKMH